MLHLAAAALTIVIAANVAAVIFLLRSPYEGDAEKRSPGDTGGTPGRGILARRSRCCINCKRL